MSKIGARIILASSVFYIISIACCMVPEIQDERLRQRGWSDVEHALGAWDYGGILIFCLAVGIMVAGIWLSNRE